MNEKVDLMLDDVKDVMEKANTDTTNVVIQKLKYHARRES